MLGVVSVTEAINKAKAKNLDLIEIVPDADPPVCKILDFGKFKFEKQRQKKASKTKQKTVKVKEIKLRPTIDTHDYNVKLNSAKKFLTQGNRVKVSLRFRGREVTHDDIGMELVKRLREDLGELAKTENEPRMEGRQIIMLLAPTK